MLDIWTQTDTWLSLLTLAAMELLNLRFRRASRRPIPLHRRYEDAR